MSSPVELIWTRYLFTYNGTDVRGFLNGSNTNPNKYFRYDQSVVVSNELVLYAGRRHSDDDITGGVQLDNLMILPFVLTEGDFMFFD